MSKVRLATYTVEVPIKLTFKATDNIESDVLRKMAECYIELKLCNTDVQYDPRSLEIIDKKVQYSAEELAQIKEYWDKIFARSKLWE